MSPTVKAGRIRKLRYGGTRRERLGGNYATGEPNDKGRADSETTLRRNPTIKAGVGLIVMKAISTVGLVDEDGLVVVKAISTVGLTVGPVDGSTVGPGPVKGSMVGSAFSNRANLQLLMVLQERMRTVWIAC